ncbi:hypothetical protein ALP86_02771 [Pseudomonas amygdali pv. mori]|uniref:Uncharacterized protein n=2 Tax=Pseudomonas amygdali pv. mori TaxID=34065 RepID=A0A0P9VGH9_PSEA0|nr:hypothetical protein PSYMO_40427 [Pseudomonas amygdali pv. mori str. 301020]KPY00557.1 Uncharacterized protein ALO63_04353 [Pseudomonas amygdali pv. mori]RMQ40578.1 hypothetical protein ALQ05_01943 [Pseudomonas amygdali pv. mori]RMR48211.1 hypothetical protein ALP86_02771 [Pseudomonas amygdali pv. mori]
MQRYMARQAAILNAVWRSGGISGLYVISCLVVGAMIYFYVFSPH